MGGRERQEPHRDLHHPWSRDHFFGIAAFLDRFPHAAAVATPEVVKAMHAQLSPESIDGFWRKRSPGQIPDRLVAAEPLDSDRLELEGNELIVVQTGKTDTETSRSRGNISSISIVSIKRRRPRANSTTECWRSTRIAPIRGRSGAEPTPPRTTPKRLDRLGTAGSQVGAAPTGMLERRAFPAARCAAGAPPQLIARRISTPPDHGDSASKRRIVSLEVAKRRPWSGVTSHAPPSRWMSRLTQLCRQRQGTRRPTFTGPQGAIG